MEVRLAVSLVEVVVGAGAGEELEGAQPSGSRTKSWFVSSHLLRTSTMNGQWA